MKTEVYGWRVSGKRKAALEEEARREGISLLALLERVIGEWLAARRNGGSKDEAEQAALRKRVMSNGRYDSRRRPNPLTADQRTGSRDHTQEAP